MGRRSRREFLQTSALAGVGFWAAGGVEGAQPRPGPNDRLNVAFVGAGGQGAGNLANVARSENIVALCDVDERHAANSFNAHPKATKYNDFRVMLEKQKDIDAVVVSTPDHTHAVAAVMAMRLGKHCYCEKPLTHNVWEARQMREVAAKHKVATQMGNGGTASDGLRRGVEIIRAGALGDVREIHIWTNRPIWPQNRPRPKKTSAVPASLHWDLWLGPAPQRPFNDEIQSNKRPTYAPFNWRGWWDFGTGALGDMACHTMNLAYMALLTDRPPTAISADLDPEGSTHINETAPMGVTVTYEFPALNKLPACRLLWYERRRPDEKLFLGQKPNPKNSGFLIIGSRGTMFSENDNGSSFRLLPETDFANFKPPAPSLPRAKPGPGPDEKRPQSAHHAEWLRACKGGPPAMSNFDYAGPFTEMILLGNVAMRVGKRITWDAANLRTDSTATDQFIRREYRKGWNL